MYTYIHTHTHTHTVPQLQIWDTAGMEQFRNALVTKYYRNADGIVLVFDITKRESFEGLDNWISEVKQYCEHGIEKIKMVLIGNKVDRFHQRKVRETKRERAREREREREGVGRELGGKWREVRGVDWIINKNAMSCGRKQDTLEEKLLTYPLSPLLQTI